MNDSERVISLGFTAERFPPGTHMCYIYNDDNQRREIASKYVESGLQGREKVGYFVDLKSPQDIPVALSALGLDLPSDIDTRGLSITRALDMYCPDGAFLPDRMLESLRSMYSNSVGEGYAGARASGEMTWALQGVPGSERLTEYEALINTIVREYPTTAVCQYDARRFDGATLFDVLAVHPMMSIRGQVVRNPYYVAPEQFLAKHMAAD
jgi:hypothetical protein